ncbi:hypothetical protein SAMN02800694_2783 [Luteibacter sp. UNCMF331Sha3.1]|nr:hypothetical protein SAMN02800694_2783 [Luteibacter sp. UNCMF331Sha3.1]
MPSSLEAHALPGARAAADHLLAFLSTLDSTAMLKPESLGRAFGVTLDPDSENGAGCTVADADTTRRRLQRRHQMRAGLLGVRQLLS